MVRMSMVLATARAALAATSLVALPALASVVLPSCGLVHTVRWGETDFATSSAAAEALGSAHLERSLASDREFVGGILRDSRGRFWGTVGAACSGQDTVTFAVAVPNGTTLAAFWHTHGAKGLFRDLFSPDDAELVRSTGRAFYLITPDGDLKVLEPRDLDTRAVRTRYSRALPRGALAGRVIEAVTACRGDAA
jgi:hypothetical protein